MTLFELFIIAVGLSMDAFAVSICKGLSVKKAKPGHCLIAGGYFGAFQAGMPLLGYFMDVQFQSFIVSIDHWIAFFLLGFIGFNMVKESRQETEEESPDFSFRAMLPLAVATSIDALAVGVTFAFLSVRIGPAVAFIGVTTFVLSALGTWVGGVFGSRFKSRAEFAGGAILMIMGARILLEHLGVLG